MDPKQRAALSALDLIADDSVVGLGTGSTAALFIDALGAALRDGQLRGIRAVPTSERSADQARQQGLPLVSLSQVPAIDITVDGADEIDPQLDLIKGLGGALLREKIVAQNSRQMVVIADAGKLVPALGTRQPLPIEVVPFEHEVQARFLKSLGCDPKLRRKDDGREYITDNGNFIYDCRFKSIERPAELEKLLKNRAGIVETGLFIGIASVALVADASAVRTMSRPAR